MSTDTVDTALPSLSSDAVDAKLISYLSNARLPTNDWEIGSFIRTLLKLWKLPLADAQQTIRTIVKGGFPVEASKSWVALMADQLFNIEKNYNLDGSQFAGTFTLQAVTLTNDVGSGPYSVVAGTFWVKSPITGNRYIAITSGTVPAGGSGSLIITVRAEGPNDSANGFNYADPPGTLTFIETPSPGMHANNAAPPFSGVSSTAVGLGVVTIGGSPPAAPTAYEVEITTSGQVGAALFQYRANGGAWITGQTTAASFTIPSGPTLHFANDGGDANPSFLVGDDYVVTSPGTPILQQGLDPETDAALLVRCQARWPPLETVDTSDKRETWAKESDPLITRVKVQKDTAYPGRVLVTIAGASNPLSGGIVTAAQLYIDQREAIGELSLVASATVTTITGTGTAIVPRARSLQIQADAKQAWEQYVSNADLGSTIRLSRLEQAIMDAGAIDATGLQLNGSPANVVLSTNAVASAADISQLGGHVTWVEV